METLLWAGGIVLALIGLVGEGWWQSMRHAAQDPLPEDHFEPWDGTL